ncbi:MAG: 3-dehydroquinate synthase [Clostridia bacterium]|nr:3-dehydroquinate synthase [Clostridia bacterium]
MITIDINAHKRYPVYIGGGLIDRAGALTERNAGGEKALIVTDNRVGEIYLERVKNSLEAAGYEVFFFAFIEGEQSKNAGTLMDILESAANLGLTRSDIFVALGGGVAGDVCGLAASLYMRGTNFVQIPTTLLAAVDSSVGGKTAIDLDAGKNLCGTFWQPSCVICDPAALDTLDPEVFSDGMAEVIKYGAICDRELFDMVKGGDTASRRAEIIERCVRRKAEIVAEDEFDTGRRAILNFGHTFGHAIEKLSGFSVSHGKAVAMGMVIAARASYKLGFCRNDVTGDLIGALRSNGLPVECGFSPDDIWEASMSDKKRSGTSISPILLYDIGDCFVDRVSVYDFKEICRAGLEE